MLTRNAFRQPELRRPPERSGRPLPGAISSKPAEFFEWVAVHSLAWLVIANGVGLLLATLVLFPSLGESLAPLTYGRWVPLHLDLQLYGWCSLPTVGLLLRFYLPSEPVAPTTAASWSTDRRSMPWLARLARLAIIAWSASLVFGALSWLGGGSSGKLFLEWAGPARVFLAFALGLLAVVLVIAFAFQLAAGEAGTGIVAAAKAVLLAALVAIPVILYWAAGPEVYPAFNPDSGGSTGGSLLGSTLGLIAVFCLTPLLLGLKRTGERKSPDTRAIFVILGLHFGWFLLLDHGNRSHHEVLQVVSLTSLLIWIPLLTRYLRAFNWPPASRRWLIALAFWGGLLAVTGVVGFLPGVLERWKFTNALVGHAHIAMAGLVSSFNVLVLLSLGSPAGDGGETPRWNFVLAATGPFKLWHLGLGAQVLALFVLGSYEGLDPGFGMRWHAIAAALHSVRWVGGAAMLLASIQWLAWSLGTADANAKEQRIEGIERDGRMIPTGQAEQAELAPRGAIGGYRR